MEGGQPKSLCLLLSLSGSRTFRVFVAKEMLFQLTTDTQTWVVWVILDRVSCDFVFLLLTPFPAVLS